jgi:hypothetical protein
MNDLTGFLLAFGLNTLTAFTIVRFVYFPVSRSRAYVFAFMALNAVLYFVLSVLTSIEVGVGVGFGLFAILSILRYRTTTIPIREMTYLFALAALPVLNTAAARAGFWSQLAVANIAIVLVLAWLERGWGFRFESSREIVYDRIALTAPERRAELIDDLRLRTGLKITRVAIGRIDMRRESVRLRAYFDNGDATPPLEDLSGDDDD